MTDEIQDNDDVVETVETETSKTLTKEPQKETHKEPKIRNFDDAIRQLREENKALRKKDSERVAAEAETMANKKLEALRVETQEKAFKDAQSLIEERFTALNERNRARIAKLELKSAAEKAGVADFDDLYVVMAKDHLSKVEFGDDETVLNADVIISDLKAKKPHFFQQVSTASTESAPRMRATPPKADIENMADADFAKLLKSMNVNVGR